MCKLCSFAGRYQKSSKDSTSLLNTQKFASVVMATESVKSVAEAKQRKVIYPSPLLTD